MQPLGDGRERNAGEHQPGAGVVPVAHMREGEDGAFAGGVRIPQVMFLRDVHAADDPLGREHRQPEALQPVAGVRAHRFATELRHVGARRHDAGEVGGQPARAFALPTPREISTSAKEQGGGALRKGAYQSPPSPVGEREQPVHSPSR